MLKIPGVGKNLSKFLYITNIDNGILEVAIIYKTINSYGITIHKTQNYELHSDVRNPNINVIKSNVDQKLTSALGTTKVTIRLNEIRHYVHIDTDQYTGTKVL